MAITKYMMAGVCLFETDADEHTLNPIYISDNMAKMFGGSDKKQL